MHLENTFDPTLWEMLVLIVSAKGSAVLTAIFLVLWEFGRQNTSVLQVLKRDK